jgi:membrane protein implicated in regulation of membrane protease activity
MALNATARRRWIGVLVLLAAVGMLICGETALRKKLAGVAFLLYWLVCFALTGLAVVIAFLDARALQRRTRQEHRDLLETTLKEIEDKARTRRRGRRPKRP